MTNQKSIRFFYLTFILFFPISYVFCADQTTAKKVFIFTVESSSDNLGAWYLEKLKKSDPLLECQAVGGPALQSQGATLYKQYSELASGYIGIGSFLWNLPNRIRFTNEIADHVLKNNFDQVVFVYSPINCIPIARKIKNANPSIKITYVAPMELWIWGKWGIDRLYKTYFDQIVVLLPFEVEWYKKNGLTVEWQGYPYLDELKPYLDKPLIKEKKIALLPGSRENEMKTMLPLFAPVVLKLHTKYPEIKFIMPVAASFSFGNVVELLKEHHIAHLVTLIDDKNPQKHEDLRACCLAITKPGTNTLILGIHQIPSVIAYKVPWITYFFARLMFQAPFVGLPNLVLDKEVCKELIQSDCTVENIYNEAEKLYQGYLSNDEIYQDKIKDLGRLKEILGTVI